MKNLTELLKVSSFPSLSCWHCWLLWRFLLSWLLIFPFSVIVVTSFFAFIFLWLFPKATLLSVSVHSFIHPFSKYLLKMYSFYWGPLLFIYFYSSYYIISWIQVTSEFKFIGLSFSGVGSLSVRYLNGPPLYENQYSVKSLLVWNVSQVFSEISSYCPSAVCRPLEL